jgi:hypothetical protein
VLGVYLVVLTWSFYRNVYMGIGMYCGVDLFWDERRFGAPALFAILWAEQVGTGMAVGVAAVESVAVVGRAEIAGRV